MTEIVNTPISGELMFKIRESALAQALGIAAISREAEVAKVVHDSAVILHFLLNGMPVETAPGYVTSPKPNTPEVLAGAGGPAVEPPKETAAAKKARKALEAAASATPVIAATAPVVVAAQAADTAPAAAALSTGSNPQTIAAPTTLQAAADSLKALVQDEARGGRKAAVDLLAKFGVAQLNQIPAPKLAEFKAALDNAGKTAPAAAVAAGSDLL